MAAISADLRERVLRAIRNGEPTAKIATRFEVSPAWVRRFHQRFRETGETAPRVRRPARGPKLAPHYDTIRALYAKTPDLTLHELRAELALTVALSTLWVAVQKLGLTFKKSPPRGRAEPPGRGRGPRPLAPSSPPGVRPRAARVRR